MQNMESLWISQIRDDGDSIALSKLVDKYRPMIDNMKKQYFIISYDRDDWYQEAFDICHQTCKIFDASSGSKFGSFYKMKFGHRIIDLIRRENAEKRKINGITESIDTIDQSALTTPSHIQSIEYTDHIMNAAARMSRKELITLRYMLGDVTSQEACELTGCDNKALLAITYKCKRKIKDQCDENLS